MTPARISHLLAASIFAVLAVVLGLTGAFDKAPAQAAPTAPAVCAAPAGALFNPCTTLTTAGFIDRRPSEAVCRAAAAQIGRTQNYSGTDTEVGCFGQEDDPRVGLALDYGQTESGYAEAEAAQVQSLVGA